MKRLCFITLLLFTILTSLTSQTLSADQQAFLRKHAKDIQVKEDYRSGDYQPILDAIGDHRIVLLGEFTHGAREVFLTRTDLVQALHEEAGFDAILFESGLGEVGMVARSAAARSPAELTLGFFGPWRTTEWPELMAYVRDEGMTIGGFDVQRTGSTLGDFLEKQADDPADWQYMEQTFGQLRSKLSDFRTEYDSVATQTTELIQRYRAMAAKWAKDELIMRALNDRATYLQYMLQWIGDKDWDARWNARDSAMAANVRWWLNELGPDHKVIIVGHNFHIARYNEKEEVMGELLATDLSDELYALGVFAGGGAIANNRGEPEDLSPPSEDGLDLKHVIRKMPGAVSFLHLPQSAPAGGQWLYEPMIVKDTFIDLYGTETMDLARCFDGLLLIDRVTVPE